MRYLEATAELQARDRGFFQATEQYLLEHPELMRRHRVDPRPGRSARRRAPRRRASLRDDVTTLDVLGLVKGAVACVPPSPACAPTAGAARWPSCSTRCAPRRPRPLPIPPLSYEEIERALGIESKVERT